MGSSSPVSVCTVCCSRFSSITCWGISGSKVGFSSSEVYSSEDNVSVSEMLGDESCPYEEKVGLLLWFNLVSVEICELRPKVVTKGERV